METPEQRFLATYGLVLLFICPKSQLTVGPVRTNS